MGITDKITGRAKQAVGDLVGDKDTKKQGEREERKGEAKEELAHKDEQAERKAAEADRKAEEVERLERRT